MVDMPVTVAVLGSEKPATVPGRILDISGRGLLLQLPLQAQCGAPIRVETDDTLLLGEVCRCEPGGEHWRVAVQVRHCLKGLAELASLNRALLGTETPAPDLVRLPG